MASVNEFYVYYIKGRVFEWTMALAMFFAGAEILIWDILSFGPEILLFQYMSQKWLGTILFFTGWIRISSLMFNGQLLFGRRLGLGLRAMCAIISAAMISQFTLALIIDSFLRGYPSIGIPFWVMFTASELLTAFMIGAEWKK